MALDFHIAKYNNEAPYKEASASFELQPHEIIFHRNGLPEGKFPLFRRMENYYKDAKYGLEELQPLIDEINEIKTIFKDNNQLLKQLDAIKNSCEKAKKEHSSVWVYCD